MRWFRSRRKAEARLKAVVLRAQEIEVEPGRFASGMGPDGPIWGDDTAKIIKFNDYLLRR